MDEATAIDLVTPLEPLRAEPRHASEMISEVRAGERLHRVGESGEWWKLRGEDGYEGWMHSWVGRELEAGEWDRRLAQRMGSFALPLGTLWVSDHHAAGPLFAAQPLLRGDAPVRERGEWVLVRTAGGDEGWLERKQILDLPLEDAWSAALNLGRTLLGTPYRWGGRSPLGFDCSGFVQYLLGAVGFDLPRDASQQQDRGTAVERAQPESWRAGDLLFFGEPADHVGLYDGRGGMLHCSGRVVREALREIPHRLERLTHVRRLGPADEVEQPTLWRPAGPSRRGA